jgi:multicomponent Na+:H+ antiporter subunit A
MPLTFAQLAPRLFSMGGLPPFFGFLAKEEIYTALAHGDPRSIVFTIGCRLRQRADVRDRLCRGAEAFPRPAGRNAEASARGAAAALGRPGRAGAARPARRGFPARRTATSPRRWRRPCAVRQAEIEITLVPHIGMPLLLSALTVLLGVGRLLAARPRPPLMIALSCACSDPDPTAASTMPSPASCVSRIASPRVQPGRLEIYITCTFLCVAAILLVPLWLYGEMPSLPAWPKDMQVHEWAILLAGRHRPRRRDWSPATG